MASGRAGCRLIPSGHALRAPALCPGILLTAFISHCSSLRWTGKVSRQRRQDFLLPGTFGIGGSSLPKATYLVHHGSRIHDPTSVGAEQTRSPCPLLGNSPISIPHKEGMETSQSHLQPLLRCSIISHPRPGSLVQSPSSLLLAAVNPRTTETASSRYSTSSNPSSPDLSNHVHQDCCFSLTLLSSRPAHISIALSNPHFPSWIENTQHFKWRTKADTPHLCHCPEILA